jgi:hypothetical protein
MAIFLFLHNSYRQHEHLPGIYFRSFSSIKSASEGKYRFVDRGKLKFVKSYEKMGR